MSICEKLLKKETKLAVVGLGYVGIPLAVEFSKYVNVIGFDINEDKINTLKKGIDPTNEAGNEEIQNSHVEWTNDENKLLEANFIIVSVPTPVKIDKTPDLSALKLASEIVGKKLNKSSIVVYESTVYPGATEEFCAPILEKESSLKCGIDFYIGYSPERVNPGDKIHRLPNIKKVVSAMDFESLSEVRNVYSLIIKAGLFEATSIKVAEAAKVIENSQRDINIAFMNELSLIFNKIGIDTKEVIEAASTKWNFLPFTPGLVGGHCIGIDPYYLADTAKRYGYDPKVILAGRDINENMSKYIAAQVSDMLTNIGSKNTAKVAILGITFKENCPDVRNSKAFDIVSELENYGTNPLIYDPICDEKMFNKLYQRKLVTRAELNDLDCIVIAVEHQQFKEFSKTDIENMFKNVENSKKIIIDVKGILNKNEFVNDGYKYWRL